MKRCMLGFGRDFYVCVYAELSSYVYSYEDVDVCDGNETGFCVLCLGACIQDQRKTWLFFIHLIIWSRMK